MSNKMYDILKNLCTKWLPGLGTLYFALCKIWNFPYGEEVVGTITAICTFIGVCIGISSKMYYGDTKELNITVLEDPSIEGHGDLSEEEDLK